MKTRYDPKGTIDDVKAIENTILSYEPLRMLSFKVTKATDAFPFPTAIKNMWTVVYFMPEGDKATRVREISMGFGSDDESRKMREFFNRGNAFTLQHLQKRFAAKADAKQLINPYSRRKTLDRSGGSVFRIALGAAKGALIRAAASTQPL